MEKIEGEDAVVELRTLRDMLRWAVSQFSAAGLFYGHGTDNPQDEAISLCCFALHLDADHINAFLDARLTAAERKRLVSLIAQRVNDRLPLPYITNQSWFAGLNFYVDQRVLIPRSPFAEIIEQQASPWVSAESVKRILDIGTGSGCLAIACAYAFDEARVDAIDISEEALAVAAINVQNHHLSDRVSLIRSDLFQSIPTERYDVILANIPYVDLADMATLPEEFQHEPQLALAAGEDGLDYIRDVIANAADHLTPKGILIGEVGNSAPALIDAFPELPFVWVDLERGGDGVFILTHQDLLNNAIEETD